MEYKNVSESRIEFQCKIHSEKESKSLKNYSNATYGMSCCAAEAIRRTSTLMERKEQCFARCVELAASRGHLIEEFSFTSTRECYFDVFCSKHKKRFSSVSYRHYTNPNVHSGVNCCAYPVHKNPIPEKVEEQLVNRTAKWRRDLRRLNNGYKCAFTTCDHNLTIQPKLGIVQGHHLYSKQAHPEIMFLPKNGVLLLTFFHLEFHKKVRTPEEITPDNFVVFLRNIAKDDAFLLSFIDSLEKECGEKNISLPSLFLLKKRSAILDGIKNKIAKGIVTIEKRMPTLLGYLEDPKSIPEEFENKFMDFCV